LRALDHYVDELGQLEPALAEQYGPANPGKICNENALRLLRDYVWAETG
jgi:hypothetical protein